MTSPLSHFDQAGLGLHRPGEGAFLVAEQLALQQSLLQSTAVHSNQRSVSARAVVVQSAGDQFLARAAGAAYQHGSIGRRDLLEELDGPLHGRAGADQPMPGRLEANLLDPLALAAGQLATVVMCAQRYELPFRLERLLAPLLVATLGLLMVSNIRFRTFKDVALTQKLLRVVNTAHYRRAGTDPISTISRAVSLIGLAGVRNLALSLMLLEHMEDKVHAQQLKVEFLRTVMAGTLASELSNTGPRKGGHGTPAAANQRGHSSAR